MLGVWPMALFNVLSVVLFATAFVLNRKGWPVLAILLAFSEIVVHQSLAVYFIGWDAGFQYYLIAVGIYALSMPSGRVAKGLMFVFQFSVYFVLYVMNQGKMQNLVQFVKN